MQIRQSVEFSASPPEVYNALMDSKLHSQFTGSKAAISKKVGGKFSAYDGSIRGTNLELEAGKKIVQKWHIDDEGWPKGHFSKAVFLFSKSKGGTKLAFAHTGVPQAAYKGIRQGWIDFYWEPLKAMLANKPA